MVHCREPTPPSRRRRLPLFGLHDYSPPSSSDEIEDALLRHLRGFSPRHHRRRLSAGPGQQGGEGGGGGGERGEMEGLERELLQAIQQSRQEHEENLQLQAGQLSLRV